MKKISIIIPCYNSAKYIVRCLDSIPNLSNIEIVLVDDCSKDNSVEIINKYIESHKRNIKLLQNKNNLGAGKTRNIALESIDTDYVLFLDSDDTFNTENLEEVLNLLEQSYDCIVFDADYVFNGRKTYLKMFFSNKVKCGLIDTKDALVYMRGCTCGKIYKYSIIKENNIVFGFTQKNEDLVFNKIAISYCSYIYYFEKSVYNYLENENSIMHVSSKYDCELDAYRYILNNISTSLYNNELNSVYFLEVVYAATMSAIRQKKSYKEIDTIYKELLSNYNKKDKYFKHYFLKYRVIYYMFQLKMFWIIKKMI